jgi:hypothetical protein
MVGFACGLTFILCVPYRQIINKLDRALGTHLPRSHKKK